MGFLKTIEGCPHPPDRHMYRQLNINHELRITVADLLGGINPYHWRVEYCADCGKVSRKFGDVPTDVATKERMRE